MPGKQDALFPMTDIPIRIVLSSVDDEPRAPTTAAVPAEAAAIGVTR
ncbi:unnamed protein product [Ixodes hexagonus]